MKRIGKLLATAGVIGMAGMGTLSTAGSAAASPQTQAFTATYSSSDVAPPAFLRGPNGEVPTEWGVSSFPMNSSSKEIVTPQASVGGGTWNYGTAADGALKRCYSNYIHPTKKHSASVAMGGATDKDIQNADIWANAWLTGGWAYTCNAYWGTY